MLERSEGHLPVNRITKHLKPDLSKTQGLLMTKFGMINNPLTNLLGLNLTASCHNKFLPAIYRRGNPCGRDILI